MVCFELYVPKFGTLRERAFGNTDFQYEVKIVRPILELFFRRQVFL